MFTKVLIPYDFSNDSEYIIRCLKNIPQIREIILFHVTRSLYLISTPERENPETDYARLRLEKVKELIEMPRSKVRVVVEEISGGEVSDAIIRIADREQVSLIMMGRRGRGVIETLLLGSTAWDVLRYCPSDLLLIHPPGKPLRLSPGIRCPDLFTNVMLCKDFSSPGIEDLCMDIYPYVTSVELFHAVTKGDSEEEVNHAVKDAKEELEKVAITCNGKDITCNIHVRVGDAADEIIRFSEEKNISLIVAKSTGRQGIVKKIVGGTTEAIARSARKPLLVLKKHDARS